MNRSIDRTIIMLLLVRMLMALMVMSMMLLMGIRMSRLHHDGALEMTSMWLLKMQTVPVTTC